MHAIGTPWPSLEIGLWLLVLEQKCSNLSADVHLVLAVIVTEEIVQNSAERR